MSEPSSETRRGEISSAILASLIESSDSPIFSVDTAYCYTNFNTSHAQVMKALYAADIEVGRCILDYATVAEDRLAARVNLDRALLGERVVEEGFSGEQARSRRCFKVTHDPIRRDDHTIGVVVQALDITERRRAEEALRQSESLLRGLFDNMPSGAAIYEVRGDGSKGGDYIIKDFNTASLRIEGKAKEEVVGKSLFDLRPTIDEYGLIPVLQRVWQTGEPALFPTTLYSDERYTNWYENRVFRLPSGETVAIYDDVTESKQAEEALACSVAQLHEQLHDTVKTMGAIVGMRDPYTAAHQRRVTSLAAAIAVEMGLDEDAREGLAFAGEVHDIGKVAVPAEILSKPATLTEMEFALIKQHSEAGRELLGAIHFRQPVAEIVAQHHERQDGSGYPRGLQGDAVLPEARILAVADVVEAMASHRPYRATLGIEAALAEVRAGAGTRYEAAAVEACERVFAEGFAFSEA